MSRIAASKVFFVLGIFLFIVFLYILFQRINPWGLESGFDKYTYLQAASHKIIPSKLAIESLSIDLPVIESKIANGKFETTKKGVSYLSSSAMPGEMGNAIFYGHNWPNILGKLDSVRVGDVIRIVMNDEKYFDYKIEYTAKVSSDEVHILNQTEDSRITIYTCAGFFDTKRFVAVGSLIK